MDASLFESLTATGTPPGPHTEAGVEDRESAGPRTPERQRSEIFRANLRRLLRRDGLSQRQAADRIGVRYKWVRRLCHHGLDRVDKRTAEALEQVARFFGVAVADLWGAGAPRRRSLPSSSVLPKWTGSKRRQAQQIVQTFPGRIDTYYEPFLGSGAVLHSVLTGGHRVERFRCSDICGPLIGIWKMVLSQPDVLAQSYAEMYSQATVAGKPFYLEVRERFNETGQPCDFFFLLRTCRNGMIRFNKAGAFSTAFHFGRPGMAPERVVRAIDRWHRILRTRDVEFAVKDYRSISSGPEDWLYLDPPYELDQRRLYYGKFDITSFFPWLEGQRGGYALSLNGSIGGEDRSLPIPESLFDERRLLDNATSATRRLNRMLTPRVKDSLYLRRR